MTASQSQLGHGHPSGHPSWHGQSFKAVSKSDVQSKRHSESVPQPSKHLPSSRESMSSHLCQSSFASISRHLIFYRKVQYKVCKRSSQALAPHLTRRSLRGCSGSRGGGSCSGGSVTIPVVAWTTVWAAFFTRTFFQGSFVIS